MTCDQEVPGLNLGHDSGCTVSGFPQSVPELPAYRLVCHCPSVSHRVHNPSVDAVDVEGVT